MTLYQVNEGKMRVCLYSANQKGLSSERSSLFAWKKRQNLSPQNYWRNSPLV